MKIVVDTDKKYSKIEMFHCNMFALLHTVLHCCIVTLSIQHCYNLHHTLLLSSIQQLPAIFFIHVLNHNSSFVVYLEDFQAKLITVILNQGAGTYVQNMLISIIFGLFLAI